MYIIVEKVHIHETSVPEDWLLSRPSSLLETSSLVQYASLTPESAEVLYTNKQKKLTITGEVIMLKNRCLVFLYDLAINYINLTDEPYLSLFSSLWLHLRWLFSRLPVLQTVLPIPKNKMKSITYVHVNNIQGKTVMPEAYKCGMWKTPLLMHSSTHVLTLSPFLDVQSCG